MDPTAAVKEIRELITAYQGGDDVDTGRLVDLMAGLDQWLTRSGHLPRQWYQY